MLRVKLTLLTETNHHTGYCSDAECQYTKDVVVKYVPLPDHVEANIGDKLPVELFQAYSKVQGIDYEGSGYCKTGHQGMDIHEHRVTVKDAEVVYK